MAHNWFTLIFGEKAKTVGGDPAQSKQSEKVPQADSHSLAWRNRYLAARIKYLETHIAKKGHEDLIQSDEFIMPDNFQTGSSAELSQINEMLAARVKYLEDYLDAYF